MLLREAQAFPSLALLAPCNSGLLQHSLLGLRSEAGRQVWVLLVVLNKVFMVKDSRLFC